MVSFAIFNELSLPYENFYEAETGFMNFFKLLRSLKNNGINKVRTEEATNQWEIARNIYFPQFLSQLRCRDLRGRLQVFLANNEVVKLENPLVTDDEDIEQLLNPHYQYTGEASCWGLACASYWDVLAVSFNSKKDWKKSTISILKDGENIGVRHASEVEHLSDHADYLAYLESERRLGITQRNFWEVKEKYFTKFEFLSKVKSEIKKLDARVFEQLIAVLRDIEIGRRNWADLNISGESTSTNNHPRCREQRTFVFKEQSCYFEQHIKNFHSGYRAHFIEKNSKIVIGYVGPHLLTATDI